jgi:hypothetical protein
VHSAIRDVARERRIDPATLKARAIRSLGGLDLLTVRRKALERALNLQSQGRGLLEIERNGEMQFWDAISALVERGLSQKPYEAAVRRLLARYNPVLRPKVLDSLLETQGRR